MAENKTKPTQASPHAFIDGVGNDQQRNDARELVALMQEITGKPPKMWGPNIVGFDAYHYTYESGREGDAPVAAFSPRKDALVLYLGPSLDNASLLTRLGKHKAGKGCLYVKKLDDVDRTVLRALVEASLRAMRQRYPRH